MTCNINNAWPIDLLVITIQLKIITGTEVALHTSNKNATRIKEGQQKARKVEGRNQHFIYLAKTLKLNRYRTCMDPWDCQEYSLGSFVCTVMVLPLALPVLLIRGL